MKACDVIIIGAGAAGLMCAIEAGKRGRTVVILDKADKIGKKILISGGGRCNYTNLNTSPDNFLSENSHFCKSALARYSPRDFDTLVTSHGLNSVEKAQGQLFCEQKAPAIVAMLNEECQQVGVEIRLECTIEMIEYQPQTDNEQASQQRFILQTSQGKLSAESLVVACGGPSIPRMGSTSFALQIAKQFSIRNIPFSPGLVPFTFADKALQFVQALSGVSCEVKIATEDKTGNLVSFRDSLLFTHRGISGPAALQISSYWQKGQPIVINLLPDINVYDWLLEQQQAHPQTELKTVLATQLPRRLAEGLCTILPDTLIDNRVLQTYKQQELQSIAGQLTAWTLYPAGTEGMRTAEVSLGGIHTDELSSKTFESHKAKGLYFIGECVDVTGHLGGYNFQWAWASGWCAGQGV